ncbi:hypothetical protein HOLleu_31669 [Holothuria leucospilota]|uniref:Uncharacterized protein n=1 Tax=Holothuria leucospilota TaxID=206669 RepID=A0A9Q0YUB1_HOLLE|nr:hypothetical protein HOLleu_31669 [Holothuria leucospilota]
MIDCFRVKMMIAPISWTIFLYHVDNEKPLPSPKRRLVKKKLPTEAVGFFRRETCLVEIWNILEPKFIFEGAKQSTPDKKS